MSRPRTEVPITSLTHSIGRGGGAMSDGGRTSQIEPRGAAGGAGVVGGTVEGGTVEGGTVEGGTVEGGTVDGATLLVLVDVLVDVSVDVDVVLVDVDVVLVDEDGVLVVVVVVAGGSVVVVALATVLDVELLGVELSDTMTGDSAASGDRSASSEQDASATVATVIQTLSRTVPSLAPERVYVTAARGRLSPWRGRCGSRAVSSDRSSAITPATTWSND
jgi:hypothetical protein